MLLDAYHTADGNHAWISAEQGSRFAKEVAGDFNPIHDPENRRFCVPGDLLFALVLSHYGLAQRMTFRFRGRVGADNVLDLPADAEETLIVSDTDGRTCLEVERGGDVTRDPAIVEPFIRSYVAFSGQTFPHILQPLLADHGVMFNPDRPLVMYDSMGFELDHLDIAAPRSVPATPTLAVLPKRADALLYFGICANTGHVGEGSKKFIISGLRDYDEQRMQQVIADYEARRTAFLDAARQARSD